MHSASIFEWHTQNVAVCMPTITQHIVYSCSIGAGAGHTGPAATQPWLCGEIICLAQNGGHKLKDKLRLTFFQRRCLVE